MFYYVYIVTNYGNTVVYTGITNNLARRVEEHKKGLVDGFTKRYKIYKLVYAEKFDDVKQAILREKQIKGYTRQKKNDLIDAVNPDWNSILPF